MKCSYCNTDLKQGAKFCPKCGKEVVVSDVCIVCGKPIKLGALFCPYCGANQRPQQANTSQGDANIKAKKLQPNIVEDIQKVEQEVTSSNGISLNQGQEITPVNNNADTVENPQRGIDSEENQEAKTSNVVEEHSEVASIPEKHKQKSKKGLFVGALLLFIVISSIALFYWKFNSNPTESNDNFVIAEAALNNENADIEGGIAYLKNFYKVLEGKGYEFNDPATSELGKYMTKAALNKLLVDNEYDDGGPAKYYDLDYFTDGQVQGDQHGDYMPEISREITYDSDNWYKIYTQFKDNTPPPTLIRIKVEKLGGNFIISDIEVNTESTPNQTSTSTSQFYDMSGNVSDYPITMHLEINGSQVKGYYYYDRQYEKRGMEAKLNLSGTYANNNLDLNETDANGVPTGHFQGQLHGGIFEGEFVTNQGKHMPFRVK